MEEAGDRRRRLARLLAALIGLSALVSAPARAQVSTDDQALELNRRSAELYKQGRYAEAAVLLREAYRRQPEPVLQYNLARACEMMADHACAVAAYESYLAKGHPADRAAVEARLAQSRARLAAQAAAPPPAPPGAEAARRSRSVLPPIVTAAGAVGIGVGVVLAQTARARHDDAVDDPTQRGAIDKQARAESLMRGANATMIAGGAIAAGGVLWWILDARAQRRAAARMPGATLHVGPGSVAFALEF